MKHSIWAAAQYAAKAAPVLPLDVAKQKEDFFCTRLLTNAAANLSLYEPVGLRFSSLKKRLANPNKGPT
jgi:hypothetical protein